MRLLLVALGAAAGAPARYLVDRLVAGRRDPVFPLGTFLVNVVGSLLLGLLVGAAVPRAWLALAGVGFCGALTTFSTFGYETVRLLEEGSYGVAFGTVALSLAAGLAAAVVGLELGALVG